MKRIIFLILLFISITACSMWEDDPYEVISTDGVVRLVHKINDKGGSIGRVSGQVLAVGSNEKYIVARRMQDKQQAELDKEVITDEVLYYYIERAKDNMHFNGEEIVKGPYTIEEFNKLKTDLGLPEFSKAF